MQQDPAPLSRPVLILAGYMDTTRDPVRLGKLLATTVERDPEAMPIVVVRFADLRQFEACRARVFESMRKVGLAEDTPVDVIGISMGGLVARYAALPRADEPTLQIRRLFTIATPHQGARLAAWPALNDLQRDMRAGSAFLQSLETPQEGVSYDLYPYTRLRDRLVGQANTAPEGMTPWWVDTPWWQGPHLGADTDPRILADIIRRLRNEPGFATQPPAPLPE